ncbi:MAG: lysylphosphatidylglycerol synthase transmembrane domain-containing protein [Candidatus Dormibacteraceae bacterium]
MLPAQPAQPGTRRLPATRLLAMLIGLGIGVVLLWLSHPAAIWEALQEVALLPILGALLLNGPVVVLRSIRAQVVLRFLGHASPFLHMIRVQLVGQTSSSVTPAASGDYLRAYIWRRTQGIPVRDGAAVVTFERLYSLYLLGAVAVILIALPRFGIIGWAGAVAAFGAATVAPVVAEVIAPPSIERWALSRVTRARPLSRFAEGALEMADNLRRLISSPALLAQTSALTLAIFVISGFQVWLLLASLGDVIHITQAVAVYTVSQVGGILSTLPFGLGAADAILVTVVAGYGVTFADAATTAVLLRATSTLPLGLAGLVEYLRLEGGAGADRPASEVR